MKKIKLISSFMVSMLLVTQTFPQKTVKEILNKSFEAMGGKEKIVNIKTLHYSGTNINELPSIAVWKDGARNKITFDFDRLINFPEMKLASTEEFNFNYRPDKFKMTFTYDKGISIRKIGDKESPAVLAQASYLEDKFYENPVFVLQEALKSKDLHLFGEELVHSVMNYVLEFSFNSMKMKLLINSLDYLPTAVEYSFYDKQNIFEAYWGDRVRRVYYSSWLLASNGIKLPTMWNTYSNDFLFTELAITNLEINPDVPADTFKISTDLKNAFLKLKLKSRDEYAADNNDGSTKLIEEGIYQSPGIEKKYNSTIVKQDDGIVIIDAPYSSSNSEIVVKKAKELFPGEKIKAVISSNQEWMHIAGLREYAAEEIPIYLYKNNKDIVEKLLDSEYLSEPDKWQENKKKAVVKTIVDKMNIGTGKNRIEIIPVRTGTAQRTMTIYFPNEKILYASDLYQPKQFAHRYWSAFLSEIEDFVEREGLDVEKVYSLHMPPVSYSELIKKIMN